jgi:hypothetical protein
MNNSDSEEDSEEDSDEENNINYLLKKHELNILKDDKEYENFLMMIESKSNGKVLMEPPVFPTGMDA